MSNIYNQQLSKALTTVNISLKQTELTESNTVQGAKLGLYNAHGLTAKAAHELKEDLEKSKAAAEQNRVATIGATTVQNIVTTSNAAIIDASNTTSSASATAASIQKAATALTNLSGSVATTLAVANSLDNGSKIQKLVAKANKATKQAAKLAEEASLIAMNLTIEASQSRAAGVVTQAGVVKTNMTTLQKSLSDTFSKQQDIITSDLAEVNSAVVSESAQSGVYKTSLAEDNAIRSSQKYMNAIVNNNLTCIIPGTSDSLNADEGSSGDQFTLSFDKFIETEDDVNIIKEYRVIIVQQDESVSFNTEAAKSTPTGNCVIITPNGSSTYAQGYITPDYDNDKTKLVVKSPVLARDYKGLPVTRGVPYTFFVYVVYTSDYQTAYNDTNGLLSMPCPYFTLKTSLPIVNANDISVMFYQKRGADAVRVAFRMLSSELTLGNDTELTDLMEFRTFIFSDQDKQAFARNQQIDKEAKKLFALEQEYRIKEERYQLAKQAYDTAVAQQASAAEIQQKKNDMEIAKAQYQTARADYNNQVIVFDQWNQGKISEFYVDEEIMESVPASNYMVAVQNSNLPKDLQKDIDEMEEELKASNDQFITNKTKLEGLNKRYSNTSDEIEKATTKENPMPDEITKIQNDLAKKIAQLEAIHSEKVRIVTEEDAINVKNQLSGEQSEQNTLLDQIIADFEKLKTIKVEELTLSKQVNGWRNELRKLSTEIVLLNTRQTVLQDELNTLPDNISNAKAQLTQLTKGNYEYFEAVNESGDFTDNYGEPLVTGKAYSAVILSIIKDSEPDAAPLFQSEMSDFSASVEFNLQQI